MISSIKPRIYNAVKRVPDAALRLNSKLISQTLSRPEIVTVYSALTTQPKYLPVAMVLFAYSIATEKLRMVQALTRL